MILSIFTTILLLIVIGYSFCLILTNSYGQIEIPLTHVNSSQLEKIDQTIATYTIIMTPRASSQSEPYHYYPEYSAIPANTTVLWYNNDTYQVHTVVSGLPADQNSGQIFASDIIPYDSYFKYTFNKGGKYSYHCEIHPWKIGFISVNDSVVRNGDFEISSGTGNILNSTDQDRTLLKLKPASFIHDPTKSIPYEITILRDKVNKVFSDVFQVTGNELQLELVPSDIATRVVGPDFIKPTTGAYHIEGRFLTLNGDYIIKIQLASVDNKPLEKPILGEYSFRVVSNQ